MTDLIKKELTLDSREVAKMVEKRHSDLIRDMETYLQYLENAKMRSQDFFLESSYKTVGNNRTYKRYDVTKKGCEFIAHKLTGQKGALFTATYINRFHEMEQALKKEKEIQAIPDTKEKEIEARLRNAKVREANVYLKIADRIEVPEYQQVMYSKATEVLSGEQLLPLPKVEEKTYTATEIGKILGISANKVGRLTNKYNLKTDYYGKWCYDKAKHCNKQIETFRYFENIIPALRKIIKKEEIA